LNIPWSSYDPVAESYASVAEPAYFAKAAHDLVSLLAPSRGVRVLDVGAGTGAVTSAMSRVVGPDGLLLAVDPAVTMLRMAARKARIRTIAGALPHIPCRTETFDVVTAGFVLSHVADPEEALAEMARVLTPGGKVGISAWAESSATTAPGRIWQSVVEGFIDSHRVERALGWALPSEERLTTPVALMTALTGAGFQDAFVERRAYDVQLSAEDFVQLRLLALPSRFMHSTLPRLEWEQFVATASRRITQCFGSRISYTMSVNLATAVRGG
jgi:SAM-dependent methyltransferase